MNLSIKDVRNRFVTPIVNIVVGLPELFRNPAATLTGWLGGAKGGWADKMTAAPIDIIRVNAKAGNGEIQLEQAEVRSAAFKAVATGNIMIASVLTNSTIDFPVSISLGRSLAEDVGQISVSTPTNADYVALPDFFKETGTLGVPKSEIDKLVVAQIAGRAGLGIAKGIGGAGGEALNKIESLLGIKPTTNSPSATTNQSPVNILNRLFRPNGQ